MILANLFSSKEIEVKASQINKKYGKKVLKHVKNLLKVVIRINFHKIVLN
jgi:hypothetical protein